MLVLIDSCGSDSVTPYSVIAAVLLEERHVARVMEGIEHALREQLLKRDPTSTEIKTNELLGRSVLRHLERLPSLSPQALAAAEQRWSAKTLRKEPLSGDELVVNAVRRRNYAQALVTLMTNASARVIATVSNKCGLRPSGDMLGKPYAFLFERIFHAVRLRSKPHHAVLVFDDEDDATLRAHNRRIRTYFSKYMQGSERARVIVPAPFYVRSSVTPLIVLPDLVAYCLAFGWRDGPGMDLPAHEELNDFVGAFVGMQANCGTYPDQSGNEHRRYPIYYIHDLRPASLQEE